MVNNLLKNRPAKCHLLTFQPFVTNKIGETVWLVDTPVSGGKKSVEGLIKLRYVWELHPDTSVYWASRQYWR
jgi:hypothetical protein